MGVIIKIRNRLGFLLIGLIAVAIVAFLFMDISSEGTAFGGSQTNVGSVNGQAISIQDFENRYQQTLDNYRASTGQQRIDEETTFSLRNDTWRAIVEEILLSNQYAQLGIDVTTDEFIDMIQGSDPHPSIVQAFSDPQTGQYDPEQVIDLVQTLDQRDPTGELRTQWLAFERSIRESRKREKYQNLVRHATYVPEWQARFDHELRNASVNIQYVYLPYDEVDDSGIEVSDREMRNYINENKHVFKQEASRTVDFVTFPIVPDATDSTAIKQWLLDRKTEFAETQDDSTYLRLYSDTDFDHRYRNAEQLRGQFTDTFFVMQPGELIGPYLDNDKFKISKLIDRKLIPDSVQARHILLSVMTQEEINAQRALADSLLTEIKAGADFATLAELYSDDVLTADRGGNMGWIYPGEKSQSINDNLFFRRSQGDVFLGFSDEGFHVVEVTQSTPSTEAVKVGHLSRSISAGRETERRIFSKASAFAGQNRTIEEFRENAPANLRTAENIKKNDHSIPGIGVAREVVQWINSARLGEVSGAFGLMDQYVVVVVTQIREKGVAPLDQVREQVKAAVLQKKKGEKLAERFQSAISGNDIQAAASSLGLTVETATALDFNNHFISGVGAEPKVVLSALGGEVGQILPPVKGNRGVFLVNVLSKEEAPAITDFSSQKQQIKTRIQNNIEFGLLNALKEAARIDDNRHRFY